MQKWKMRDGHNSLRSRTVIMVLMASCMYSVAHGNGIPSKGNPPQPLPPKAPPRIPIKESDLELAKEPKKKTCRDEKYAGWEEFEFGDNTFSFEFNWEVPVRYGSGQINDKVDWYVDEGRYPKIKWVCSFKTNLPKGDTALTLLFDGKQKVSFKFGSDDSTGKDDSKVVISSPNGTKLTLYNCSRSDWDIIENKWKTFEVKPSLGILKRIIGDGICINDPKLKIPPKTIKKAEESVSPIPPKRGTASEKDQASEK